MPVAKSLNKLTQQKGSTKLHPRGRKLKQLSRAQLRQNKLDTARASRQATQDHKLERLRFLQQACLRIDQTKFSIAEIHEMIAAFIDRGDAEIRSLESARRPGRPTTPRYDSMVLHRDSERKEYLSGFMVPDLTNEDVVERLKAWNGTQGGTNVLEFKRLAMNRDHFE